MARVFISYRHIEPDQAVARYLYHYLSDLDHDVFFDAHDIPVGSYWDKEIGENVRRAEFFIPLVSSSYLFSEYIVEKELKVAAGLLRDGKVEQILQVNLAYDGHPPEVVREVVNQIQHFKWRSPADTPRLCEEIASRLPAAESFLKGMRAFVTADERIFAQLGREEEVSAFLSLLRESPAPYVLLHGVSGAGKTSFLRAGVMPRYEGPTPSIAELAGDEAAGFEAVAADGSALVVLDQFEQSLIRFAMDEAARRGFEKALTRWGAGGDGRKLVFCIRDEYRTPFDTMLPDVATHCAQFPLLPLRPEVAARVLKLLLENIGVEYNKDFLPAMCAEYLAEGVPKTVLPALLQLVAQYFRNRGLKLNKGEWDRLTVSDSSLFEDHVQEAVLERLPHKLSQVEATGSLAALTEGDVKSRAKSTNEVNADYQLGTEVVTRTLEAAALPHARVVAVELEPGGTRPRYRLIHDLFAPAVQALHRDAKLDRDKRRRRLVIAALASLLLLSLAAGALALWQWRAAERQRNVAVARQLAAESNALRDAPGDLFQRSVLLAIEAHRRLPTVESDAALRAALTLMPRPVAHLDNVWSVGVVQFSQDGTLVATGAELDGKVSVWEIQTGQQVAGFDVGQPVKSLAFSEDGGALAVGAGYEGEKTDQTRGLAVVWDWRAGRELQRAEFGLPVRQVAFVRDGGGRVAAATRHSTKVLSTNGTPPQIIGSDGVTTTQLYLSNDGRRLIVMGTDKGGTVYDLLEGRPVPLEQKGPFPAGSGLLPTSLATPTFSADGSRLAVQVGAGVQVWDVASGKWLATLQVDSPLERPGALFLKSLALSDDGALVAGTGMDGVTVWWDMKNEKGRTGFIRQDSDMVASLSDIRPVFRPNSYDLFIPSGTAARMYRLTRNGGQRGESGAASAMLRLLPGANSRMKALALSPDGRFAVAVNSSAATVWELETARSAIASDRAELVGFSASGRFIVAWETGNMEVFDAADGHRVANIDAEPNQPEQTNGPRAPQLLDGAHGPPPLPTFEESLAGRRYPGRGLFALSKTDDRLGFLSLDDNAVWIHDLTARSAPVLVNCGGPVDQFSFTADGRAVLCAITDGSLRLADLSGGPAVEIYPGGPGQDLFGFSPSGRYFYVAYMEDKEKEELGSPPGPHMVEVFEVAGARRIIRTPSQPAQLIAHSPDDKYMAIVPDDKTLAVWEMATGKEVRRFPAGGFLTDSIAFGEDGLLAIATQGEVVVWDVLTGERRTTLRHEEGAVREVAFSPDARHLLTVCDDGRARVWNLRTGSVEVVVEGVSASNRRMAAFGPGGRYFVVESGRQTTTGETGTARVVRWWPQDLIEEACQRVVRNMTPEEWAQHVGSEEMKKTCPNLP